MSDDTVLEMKSNEREIPVVLAAPSWIDVAGVLATAAVSRLLRLARELGLTLCDNTYFMFFLSLAYWLSRIKPPFATMSSARKNELIAKQHQVPVPLIIAVLSAVFATETPLGHHVRFPWGTSILAVLKK